MSSHFGSHGLWFESWCGTNLLWQDINLYLPLSTQVRYLFIIQVKWYPVGRTSLIDLETYYSANGGSATSKVKIWYFVCFVLSTVEYSYSTCATYRPIIIINMLCWLTYTLPPAAAWCTGLRPWWSSVSRLLPASRNKSTFWGLPRLQAYMRGVSP